VDRCRDPVTPATTLRHRGTATPRSVPVVVPAGRDADLGAHDPVDEAVLIGDAP
jgi:hypothetical protein